jgi:hypothetical protein
LTAPPPEPEPEILLSWPIDMDGCMPLLGHGSDELGYSGVSMECSSWSEQVIPGTIVAVNLTMTWTPGPGSTTSLRLFLAPLAEGEHAPTDGEPTVEGESPLRLEAQGLDMPAGRYGVCAFWGAPIGVTPLGQEFHVTGELLYRP